MDKFKVHFKLVIQCPGQLFAAQYEQVCITWELRMDRKLFAGCFYLHEKVFSLLMRRKNLLCLRHLLFFFFFSSLSEHVNSVLGRRPGL